MKPRIKFGLIVGGIALVLNICVSAVMGICGPFTALIAGAIAGLLAARQETLGIKKDGAQCGAIAGAVAGALVLIGQLLGGVGVLIFTQMSNTSTLFGEVPPPTGDPMEQVIYYGVGVGVGVCIGLGGIVVSAISGAVAGYLATPETSVNQPPAWE